MASPVLAQNASTTVVLYLEDLVTGNAAIGLTFADVSCELRKGPGSFVSLTLDALNFIEINQGFYSLSLTAANTDTLGVFSIRTLGGTIRPALLSGLVVSVSSITPTPITPPSTVAMFGSVFNSNGTPAAGASVSARILSQPTIVPGMALTNTPLVTRTDSAGFFSLSLIEGVTVDVFIGVANFRRTISVPGTSFDLFDLP